MRTIVQSLILLRNSIEFPDGLRLTTEDFREDWSFVKSANALRLGEQLILHGWSFAQPLFVVGINRDCAPENPAGWGPWCVIQEPALRIDFPIYG